MGSLDLARSFQADIAVWLAVTLLLGGAGAFATGRALARGWQPAARLIRYMLILAGASGFLCWALFDVPVIPGARIVSAVSAGDSREAFLAMAGYAASFALLLAIAGAGFTFTRVGQMRAQYPFLFSEAAAPAAPDAP